MASMHTGPAAAAATSWPQAPRLPLLPIRHCCGRVLTDLVLAAHIPHGEADVLVFHSLHVEACRGRAGGKARHGEAAWSEDGRRAPASCGDGGFKRQRAALALPAAPRGHCCSCTASRWPMGPPRCCGHRSGHAPMVGMVVTISPSFSLYKMVVLPAASRPTCTAARSRGVLSGQAGRAGLLRAPGRIVEPRAPP